jgi:serine/threonine protein kinase
VTLVSGHRLGPYEIVAPLGAGGMGEVYRARDTRLGREVAIKVLPAEVSADAGRLRRFEKEARSASSLNHPNIVTVYDVGNEDSTSYIAMELVEGVTLRQMLTEGPLPLKKLLAVSAQVADGLAKAHAAGIVHRDLKPENVMVTKDGFAKILDFGLAKLARPEGESAEGTQAPTVSGGTEPGIVVGTVAYMSPEQALGKPLDFRSDQFSLGSVLYEMATGRRAFARASGPETMTAIIREEPEAVAALAPKTPAPLRWTIERCLSKEPDERYGSTQDLARDLSTVRDHLSEAAASAELLAVSSHRARAPKGLVLATLALIAVAGGAYWVGHRRAERLPPSYHRLTYRRGNISGARFSPDGQTILYSAAWDGKPLETYLMRRESSDARSLGFPGAHLWSVSSKTEMALGLEWTLPLGPQVGSGTLARVPLAGGTPREVRERVEQADWSPDGKSLALARPAKGKTQIEFPAGKTLYASDQGSFMTIRVSPTGDLIAFIESGTIAVVDTAGRKRELSSGWSSAQGLAWSPRGDEVWFTASKVGHGRALWSVSLSGRERLLTQVPGRLTLQDIARDGSVLLTHESVRREMVGLAPGESRERDLTWLGYSMPIGLSPDGKTVAFRESSEEGALNTVYVRKTDGSSPIRIGESMVHDIVGISPDGRWVFAGQPAPGGQRYELLPTGPGDPRPLAIPGLDWVGDVKWFPDGKHLLVEGFERGKKARDYIVDFEGAQPVPVTPEGVAESVISPDGKWLAAEDDHGGFSIYPVGGGEARQVAQDLSGIPVQWSADGKSVYLSRNPRFDKLELSSGRVEPWKQFQPADPTGVLVVQPMFVAPDGKSYIYTYVRVLSDLYLVEGLR